MSRKRPYRSLALAALAAAISSGALARSASAITYVSDSGSAGMNQQGSVEVDCPAGEKVLGGGIISSGFYGSSYINTTQPQGVPPFTAWVGYVDAYTPVNLTVRAICQGGGVASKLKYRFAAGHVDAAPSRETVTAKCPNGYHVTGGGVSNSDGFGNVEMKVSRPVDGGTAWEGEVWAFSGDGADVGVDVICAKGGFARHLVYRSKTRTVPDGQQLANIVRCPQGAKVVGGGVAARKSNAKVNTTSPDDEDGWASWVDGYNASVKFTTYAICHT